MIEFFKYLMVVVVAFVIGIFTGTFIERSVNLYGKGHNIIKETCEAELPRNQTCEFILTAEPKVN